MLKNDGVLPQLRKKSPEEKYRVEWYGFCSMFGLGPRLVFLSDIDQGERNGVPNPIKHASFTGNDVVKMLDLLLDGVRRHYDSELRKLQIDPDRVEYRLIMDNAPWHNNRAAISRVLRKHGMTLESFPTYSSDLNVVELVWHSLKQKIEGEIIDSAEEAKDFILKAYEELLQEEKTKHTFANLCKNYRARLEECRSHGGGRTHL